MYPTISCTFYLILLQRYFFKILMRIMLSAKVSLGAHREEILERQAIANATSAHSVGLSQSNHADVSGGGVVAVAPARVEGKGTGEEDGGGSRSLSQAPSYYGYDYDITLIID